MRYLLFLLVAAFLSLLVLPGPAEGHEVRPALLQLTEVEPDRFDLLWRVPARGARALALEVLLPENCRETGPAALRSDGARNESRSQVICEGGLAGATVAVAGLQRLRTNVLVRVDYLGGGAETLRALPEAPQVTLTGQRSLLQVAGSYLLLGIEHILLGIDHLLFVFALMLLVASRRKLIWTVTAFTLAHSITLAGATLGWVSAPTTIIEPLIALSIVFVAAEVIQRQRGHSSLAISWPWVVAFGFGLLHGFGFAGALTAVGLPPEAVPTALLFFNLGVEVGQLLFIALLLVMAKLVGGLIASRAPALTYAAASAVGVLAGFWTVERVSAIWV